MNGNLVSDLNKGIAGSTGIGQQGGGIQYNHLNLPWRISVKDDQGNPKGTISYVYDGSGNKLQKRVVEYAGAQNQGHQRETVTTYLGGFVYEQVDAGPVELQFMSHEEGRVRMKMEGKETVCHYDYFIKDHLGNVRMVLTDEKQQDLYPAASLETATLAEEMKYYRIPGEEAARVKKVDVPGYPQDDSYTNPNEYIQKLNGSGTKIGTSIVLRVMSGDRVNIHSSSWYRQNGATGSSGQSVLKDVVTVLAEALTGNVTSKGVLPAPGDQPGILTPAVADFLTQEESDGSQGAGKPRAYLNWILLDEQLKVVMTGDGKNSGYEQVGEDQEFKVHDVIGRKMTRNGYLYIYVSNETPGTDVFFDNLQVTHIKGPLMEETHYYPFGLTMAGISSKAIRSSDYPGNRKKYNGIEFNEDLDLDTYEAFYRNLDPQTGRWWQIDPKVDEGYESISPYASMYDDPARYSDPLGDEPDGGPGPGFIDELKDIGRKAVMFAGGAVNAWASNQILGAGRADVDNMEGLSNEDKVAAKAGQTLGDGLSMVTGALETGVGATAEIASLGIVTPIAIPVAVHGASSVALGALNLVKGSLSDKKDGGNAGNNRFNGQSNTESKTRKEAFNKAKDQNGIPRSQQPDRTFKRNEASKGQKTGRQLREYEYTSSSGKKVSIRKDNPTKYHEGGNGDQGNHYNAGETGRKLKQHHNYETNTRRSCIQ